MARLCLIVAMAKNRVIGRGNDLPWHIPEDLKRFKALTIGKPVIMGRKTFESILSRIKKPLPERHTIVLSRDFSFEHKDVTVCASIDAARDTAKNFATDEAMVAGGAQIYTQFLPHADRIYLTEVDLTPDGDAWFPDFTGFHETERTAHISAAGITYADLILDRVD